MNKLEKQKKFALECRKVRMFIAAHPGTNSYEIRQDLGKSPSRHLSKMVGMGIVKVEGLEGPYYVVPQ